MIGNLPEGTFIGRMKASIEWVISHTARFAGVVIITIQDGSGFILIDKGKPLYYYFRHGQQTLEGNNAYDYFHSFPVISFELKRYDPREMSEADDQIRSAGIKPVPVAPLNGDLNTVDFLKNAHSGNLSSGIPAASPDLTDSVETGISREDTILFEDILEDEIPKEKTGENTGGKTGEIARGDPSENTLEQIGKITVGSSLENTMEIPEAKTGESTPDHTGDSTMEMIVESTPDNEEDISMEMTVEIAVRQIVSDETGERPVISQDDYTDEGMLSRVGELLLGQLVGIPGVLAVSLFNRDIHLLSLGEVNLEHLVDAAEDLMYGAREVSSLGEMGPFVQMTLQLPSGNVIIAPYWDDYLCILTSPDINLGQIRKIVRHIPPGQQAIPRKA